MKRAIVFVLVVACSKATPDAGKGRKLEYPVQVAPLQKRHVQYAVTAPGSIDAFQQVQITARVAVDLPVDFDQTVWFRPRPEKVHYFDSQTSEAVRCD